MVKTVNIRSDRVLEGPHGNVLKFYHYFLKISVLVQCGDETRAVYIR